MRSSSHRFLLCSLALFSLCGTAKLVPLTVAIEMAGDETGGRSGGGNPSLSSAQGAAGFQLESVPPMGKFGLRQNSPVTDHTAGPD
jgi:hypothetical protein